MPITFKIYNSFTNEKKPFCHQDGSFVSGGEKDASLIVFNSEYELIGAGAVLTPHVGGVRALLKRNLTSADGIWFFHLIVGTTLNCIVDVTFR